MFRFFFGSIRFCSPGDPKLMNVEEMIFNWNANDEQKTDREITYRNFNFKLLLHVIIIFFRFVCVCVLILLQMEYIYADASVSMTNSTRVTSNDSTWFLDGFFFFFSLPVTYKWGFKTMSENWILLKWDARIYSVFLVEKMIQ